MKILLYTPIIFLPFQSMLAASDVLTLSNLSLMFVIIFQLYSNKCSVFRFDRSLLLVIIVMLLSTLSTIINFNKIIDPLIVIHHFKELFLALLFIIYLQLLVTSRSHAECNSFLFLMAKITILIGIIDFLSVNTGLIDLDTIIPRSNVQHNSGTIASVSRLRGTFEEAGHYGTFATLFLIPVLYSRNSNHFSNIFIWRILLIVSVILTFSVLTLVALLLAVISFLTVNTVGPRIKYKSISQLILTTASIAAIIYTLSQSGLLKLIQSKIFGQHPSKIARQDKLNNHLSLINENLGDPLTLLFGSSPDLFKQIYGTGSLNNYLELLADFGLLGCLILIAISFSIFRQNYHVTYILYLVPMFLSLGLGDILYYQFLLFLTVLSIVNKKDNR